MNAFLLVACLWLSGSALDDGIVAYEAMDLEGAKEQLLLARAQGGKERAKAELWLGIVELELGHEDAGDRWIRSALAARPTLTVPAAVSPKIRSRIEATRATLPPPPEPAKRVPRRVNKTEPAAPLASPPPKVAAPPATPTPAPMPASTPAPGSPTAPVSAASPPVASQVSAASDIEPLWVGAGVLLGVSLTTLALGGVLGFAAQQSADGAQDAKRADDALDRFDQAKEQALVANGLFAGAGLFAVGAVVLVVVPVVRSLFFTPGELAGGTP